MDGVGAGLVHRFSGGDVPVNQVLVEGAESHDRGIDQGVATAAEGQGHAGMHGVFPSGKNSEHPFGIVLVDRFAKTLIAKGDDGVGGEDRTLCVLGDMPGLVLGCTAGEIVRTFAGFPDFVDV